MHSTPSQTHRRLAAILFADIAGYTTLMHADEHNALQVLNRFKAVIEGHVPHHAGEIVQFYGDGCLMSFATAAEAVHCARHMQELFRDGATVPVRMGVHLGDIVFRDDNAFGDSVNIASRIESMGIPGAVLYSAPVEQQIRNQGLDSVSLGTFTFKNLPQPMEVFALRHDGLPIPEKGRLQGKFAQTRRPASAYRIVAIAILVLVGAGAWMFTRSPDSETPATAGTNLRALAILPFENTPGDAELAYLADGIPGNLINRMSALPDLRVLARSATFSMRDSTIDYVKIKELLDADILLTGQVSRVSDYLVVNCELIDVDTRAQIWGHRISNKATDLMQLEDSLVRALMHPLELQLKSGKDLNPHRKEIAAEAYDHYMQGRHLTYGSTLEESEKAIGHFRRAIEIEPRYADAYAALANEMIIQAIFSTNSQEEIMGEARTAAQSAIGLDPTLAEAHLAKASIAFYGDYDWKAAGDAYGAAYQANQNDPTTLIRYSAYLAAIGRTQEAIPMAELAARIDPVSISSLHNLGWVHFLAKDYVNAKRAFGKALDLHPDWIWGHTKKGYAHVHLGECDTASLLADRGVELLGEWGSEVLQASFIWINARCDNAEKTGELMDRFFAHIDEHGYEDPLAVAFAHYAKRDYETTIDWAGRMIEERSPSAYLLIIESFWDPELYTHSRFQALLKELQWDPIIAEQLLQ